MQFNIILPDLGQTSSEAKISRWLKRPGDRVERGEPVMLVETDKVDMEVESFETGYVREFLVAEGSIAKALEPVAILTETPDENYEPPHRSIAPDGNGPVPAGAVPGAKALARELGVNLADVKGTGPKGLITRADVQQCADARAAAQAPKAHHALRAMAATVAASKRDIPHFYATRDLEMSRAARWRDHWNQAGAGPRASFNDVFVWCAARSLADVPGLNITLRDGNFEQHSAADVLVVVARENTLLLTPVADPTSLDWREFIKRVHQAQPAPTVTPRLAISNLGMYGLKEFSAIIPPGCSSMLAIGAVREAPVVRDGAIVIERLCTCTLSADHRVMDGIAAARFLDRMQFHLNSL